MDRQNTWKYALLVMAVVFLAASASLYFLTAGGSNAHTPPAQSGRAGSNLSLASGGSLRSGGSLPTGQTGSTATVAALSPTPTTEQCLLITCTPSPGGITPTTGPSPAPSCTLQAPSAETTFFSGEAGSTLAHQTFTIGAFGGCTGNLTITPTVTTTSGGAWLTFSPASASIAGGSTATFTLSVTTTGLAMGTYRGTLSLAAVEGGTPLAGSPQAIAASLVVLSPPALAVRPAVLTFTQATGSATQSIQVTNTGGAPLDWAATLAGGAPASVTISSGATGTLAGGASKAIKITVDTTGLPGGTTLTTGVTISATDPASGRAVAGGPATVSISITPSPPSLQLSATALRFLTTAGTNPAPQTISLTNSGRNTLHWSVGTPSQPWLTVSPPSGSDAAGASTLLTFTVTAAGLPPSFAPYTATVTIIPKGSESPQTVSVSLIVI